MFKISRGKIITVLFYVWILSAAFAYIPYAAYAWHTGTFVYWNYNRITLAFPWNSIRYIKDVAMLLLFLFLLRERNYRPYIRKFLPLIGVFVVTTFLLNKGYAPQMIVAGVREFLPVLVCLLLSVEIRNRQYGWIKTAVLYRITAIIVYIEVIFVMMQICREGIWSNVGKAGYRLPGTTGNGGSLGYLAIGTSVFIFSMYAIGEAKVLESVFLHSLSFFISLASGSRNAVFVLSMISIFILFDVFLSVNGYSKRKLYQFVTVLLLLSFIPIIKVISDYAGRGNLNRSGDGRIKYLIMRFQRPLPQLLIGGGIGDGTNAYVNMGGVTPISDGTFTAVISQFGLIGLLIFLIIVYKLLKRIIRNRRCNRTVMIVFVIAMFVSLISINVFEQPLLIIYLFLTYYLLMRDVYFYPLKKQTFVAAGSCEGNTIGEEL